MAEAVFVHSMDEHYEVVELHNTTEDAAAYAASLVTAHQEYPGRLGYVTPTMERITKLLNLSNIVTFALRDRIGRVYGATSVQVDGEDAVLGNAFRLKEVQGVGVGRRLILHALGHAMTLGAQRVALEVMADNPVRVLYGAMGFREYVVDDYLGLDERSDTVSMELCGRPAITAAMDKLRATLCASSE